MGKAYGGDIDNCYAKEIKISSNADALNIEITL
jgi:hypothetical protein